MKTMDGHKRQGLRRHSEGLRVTGREAAVVAREEMMLAWARVVALGKGRGQV